jgi:hypothetical protein
MERRDWSLKAYKELIYIDSLEDEEKASLLLVWGEKYISDEQFELSLDELKIFSELFYKNINFLKTHKDNLKQQLDSHFNIKKFLI